ncbi:MAG: LLM class flavin-dependent oxidoreductase [Acidimicrobiales bacterium]|nr:LLM class flavin-dependent oxidoreductase [Acidimicrobiales bacterium]
MSLQIGIVTAPGSPDFLDYAIEAERLGIDSVWVPEYWEYDAFTPLAAIAAVTKRIKLGTGIAQIGARSPAMLAMTAMSLHTISNGRFVLGIGTSGPQVMEGWHGVHFARPIQRTRETIEIVRLITAGERLQFDGKIYQLPLPNSAGRAIRSQNATGHLPIYVASLGPANLALTGELADGWIGNSFFTESAHHYFDHIAGGAQTAGRALTDLDLTVAVSLEFTDDVEEAGRRHADGYAFTFGAMGSGRQNFYNTAFARQGFAADVAEVQRLWQAGDRLAAAARVPLQIGLRTNLIGPPAVVRERLREYAACGATTLRINPMGNTLDLRLDALGQLMDLINELNAEPSVSPSPDQSG